MEYPKKHIIFDLDDTIWDYQQNSKDTLLELWQEYKLEHYGVTSGDFISSFRQVNNKLWDQFDQGTITRNVIRQERFPRVFEHLQLNLNGAALKMQDSFMASCAAKPKLVNGTLSVLNKYKNRYQFQILSNGFDEIQFTKLKAAKIESYFTHIITSGKTGFRKPEREIFEIVLETLEAKPNECVMIGDNPISDIAGAANVGIEQIYYNVHNKPCPITPTHTITHMQELLYLLE